MYALSIIIPTYNYEHYLRRAIDSVLRQLGDTCELIVVDDGSTDKTQSLVATIREDFGGAKNFRYFYQENAGVARARNQGAHYAKGQYLLFLDADDALAEGALQSFLAAMNKHPAENFFIARYETILPNGKIKPAKLPRLSASHEENFKAYLIHHRVSVANGTLVIKKEIFFALGGYPEQLKSAEDMPFNALLLALYTGKVIDSVVLQVHRHTDSLRHEIRYYQQSAWQTVEAIFNEKLPSSLFKYKDKFYLSRCLSLFRLYYLSKDYKKAREVYHQAFLKEPTVIFQFSYLRKYLKSWMK
jgi:glycosyltransferase involved in cell wall biosynthesis